MRAQIAMSDDIICLTDLHGAFYTMVRLLNRAPKGVKIVLLGDLVDRGPHSRKVVEFAMEHKIPTTMGNHEDLALAYSEHAKRGYKAHCSREYERDIWLYNGGDWALGNWPHFDSKGHRCGERIPDDVLSWMAALPPYLYPSERLDENGRRLLASHTGYGLNADTGNWFSTLWGRYPDDGYFATEPQKWKPRDDGLYRVFGHTRTRKAEITDTYARIDTGAAYGPPYGTLSALLWPSKTVLTQTCNESPCEPTFTIVDGRLA